MIILLCSLRVLIVSALPIQYIPSSKIPPDSREYPFMDYLESQDSLCLFSGAIGGSTLSNDLWAYSFTNEYWTLQIPTAESTPCIF